GPRSCAQRRKVVAKVGQELAHFLDVGELAAAAEHVGGESDIAQLCDSASPFHDVLAQTQSLVKHEHSRPRVRGRLVDSEVSQKFDCSFAVTNVLRVHLMLPWSRQAK